jgi:hypothetical protein
VISYVENLLTPPNGENTMAHFVLTARMQVEKSTTIQSNSIHDVQLIGTHDDSVRRPFRYSGILGLNSLDNCTLQHSSSAFVNQLRGKNNGFSIDLPQLIFESDFSGFAQAKYDGKFFEIKIFEFGKLISTVPIMGMIDLESKFIKIPFQIYDKITQLYDFKAKKSLF